MKRRIGPGSAAALVVAALVAPVSHGIPLHTPAQSMSDALQQALRSCSVSGSMATTSGQQYGVVAPGGNHRWSMRWQHTPSPIVTIHPPV